MWKHDKHFEKETDVEILTSIERDKINKLKEKHMTRKKKRGPGNRLEGCKIKGVESEKNIWFGINMTHLNDLNCTDDIMMFDKVMSIKLLKQVWRLVFINKR